MWISQKKVWKILEILNFQTSRTLRLLGVRQSSWALRNRTPRELSIAAVFSLSWKLLVPPTNAGLEGKRTNNPEKIRKWGKSGDFRWVLRENFKEYKKLKIFKNELHMLVKSNLDKVLGHYERYQKSIVSSEMNRSRRVDIFSSGSLDFRVIF